MDYSILTSQAAVAKIAGEWDALQKRAGRSIFTAYGWVDNWWRHLGESHGWKLHVVIGREDGRLVAVAPMAITKQKGVRILNWAGADISDYSDFLLENPAHSDSLWVAIRKSPYFDIARVKEIHSAALCLAPVKSFGQMIRTSPARQIRINWPSAEAWRASLPSSVRQFQRKGTRKLEAEGKVEFEVFVQEPLDENAFAEMIRYKKEWAELYGKSSVFCCDGALPFFRSIARLEDSNGQLHFSVLRCNGEVAAVHFGFVVGGAFYCYLPAYNSKWRRFSPGKILLLYCIGWAVDNGCHEFDFLRGEADFKNWLANESRPLEDYSFAVTLKGKLAQWILSRKRTKDSKAVVQEDPSQSLDGTQGVAA